MTTPEALVHLYAAGEHLARESCRLREEAAQLWADSQQIIAESRRLVEESSALARRRLRMTPACGFLVWTYGLQPRWLWRKRQLETNE